ncbi:MAG: hypothetical protein ACLQPD_14735 [Desulfomonilaceae bacterium]
MEAVTIKELGATIGARSDKLQLAGCEMASGDRQSKGSIPHWKPKRPDLSGRYPAEGAAGCVEVDDLWQAQIER